MFSRVCGCVCVMLYFQDDGVLNSAGIGRILVMSLCRRRGLTNTPAHVLSHTGLKVRRS